MPDEAATTGMAPISAEQSFQVHLQSLMDFARDLDGQFQAVRRPTDDLAAVARLPVLLGDFAEASWLRDSYAEMAQQMHDLLDAVRAAIAFAGDVTHTIGDSYEHYDDHIAGLYGHGRLDIDPAHPHRDARVWATAHVRPGRV